MNRGLGAWARLSSVAALTVLALGLCGLAGVAHAATAPSAVGAGIVKLALTQPSTAKAAISGVVRTGSTVSAARSGWSSGTTFTYQWRSSGRSISGATASTYKIPGSLVGKSLTVTVTGRKTGYTTLVKTSAAVRVASAPQPTSASVRISGSARPGLTVTASRTGWYSGTTFTYQWKANGWSMSGATASTYKIPSSLLGKSLTVTVTGRKTGYSTLVKTSTAVKVTEASQPTSAAVQIKGAVRADSSVTAAPSGWATGTTYTYQWKSNGASISGATASTYTIPTSLLGKDLTVTVKGTKAGYTTVSRSATAQVYGSLVGCVSDASNEARMQAYLDAYPLTTTGDKGAVVFRYDHGLTDIKSTLLPLHQARGIPFYIAINSRTWNIGENSGATKEDVRNWLASGLVEIGNHTADHLDHSTPEELCDTIVNGRKELEAQLGTVVHGFTVPGVSGTGLGGFWGGTQNSFSTTLAGPLVLNNHAVTSGAIGPTFRPMDGDVRQGGEHYTWERATFDEVKAQIDEAIATKTAITIMAHPRNLNHTGYWTPALATQVLDYVESKIASGELASITYYQSLHAKL